MGQSNNKGSRFAFSKLFNCINRNAESVINHKLENSEQKIISLVEPIAVPIAFTNFRGRFTYVNEELAKLLGYSVKELVGRPFKDFIHPKERRKILRLFFNIVALPRQCRVLEFMAIRKDGTVLNLWSKPSKLVINGKTVGFQAIILDLTDFKNTEQSLRQVENNNKTTLTFLGNILGNISDAVTVVDEDYTYRFLNESAKKILGNVNGEKCYKILRNRESPCYHIGIPCEVYEILEKNQTSYSMTRTAGKTGKILEIHATPMIETNGKRNVIVASRDVTEEKNAIEKLKKSFAQLNATLESTADGILVTDENGKITNYNQKFVEILNIPKSIL
jgi:PAS domain S-box-containing protein